MADFTLDTSGAVNPNDVHGDTIWPDLSPFEQGYTRAALEELQRQRWAQYRASCASSPGNHLPVPLDPAYSWLAPETLAAIRKDCVAALNEPQGTRTDTEEAGRKFYVARQTGRYSDVFPPFTVILGDDGHVYPREAG